MRIAVFDTHQFERKIFEDLADGHEFTFFEPRLTEKTALMAQGFDAVCSFVNDKLDASALKILADQGIRLVVLRCAGFNHVDLTAAKDLGIAVTRVPAYSPYAVAEHAVSLILTLNRKTHRAYTRVKDLNFSLDGLIGFDLHGKTVGVVGTGKIGSVFCQIMRGFGCKVIAHDLTPNQFLVDSLHVEYVDMNTLLAQSDIISLHTPLNRQTKHIIDRRAIRKMKSGVMLINTSRGGLIDTPALIAGLKSHQIGSAGLDVYEEEEHVFFRDLSVQGLEDDTLARLLTFPNVLITSHQAFLTHEALSQIAQTTVDSLNEFDQQKPLTFEVLVDPN